MRLHKIILAILVVSLFLIVSCVPISFQDYAQKEPKTLPQLQPLADKTAAIDEVTETDKARESIKEDSSLVKFVVHIPQNTPPTDTIFLVIKNFNTYFTDSITCKSLAKNNCQRIAMKQVPKTQADSKTEYNGHNLWEAEVELKKGSLVKYVYDRGKHLDEVFMKDHGGGSRERFDKEMPIYYRYLFVADNFATNNIDAGKIIVTDTVAMWEDIEKNNDINSRDIGSNINNNLPNIPRGIVKGGVTDKTTGKPLMDITVSIAGIHLGSGYNGEFELENVPAGTQRVVVSTETGRYKYASKEIIVKEDEISKADFELEEAKKVKVTFNVEVPEYTPDFANVRISGNIYQLGSVWWYKNLLYNSPVRYVEMQRRDKISKEYTLTMDLYGGIYLEYVYHLGRANVNTPVDEHGTQLAYSTVIGDKDTILNDKVSSWSRTISSAGEPNISPTVVTLYAETPKSTPIDEIILIGGGCSGPHTAMYQISANTWALPLFDHNYGGGHRYIRGIAAPPVGLEEIDKKDICKNHDGPSPGTFDGKLIMFNDTIKAWRWDAEVLDYSFSVVPVKKRKFYDAVDLLDFYDPDFLPIYSSTFNHLKNKGINWVAIPTGWQYARLKPLPKFEQRSFKTQPLGIPSEDFKKIVSMAKERDSKGNNLKVILYLGLVAENLPNGIHILFGAHSNEWYDQWFNEFERFMLYHAKLAEELNVEMIVLPRTSILNFQDESYKETFNNKMKELLKKFKQEYSGLITSEEDTYTLSEKYNFFTEMDYLGVLFDHALDLPDTASVQEIEKKFGALLDEKYKPISDKYGKSFIFTQVHYPSVSDALSKGGTAANLAGNEEDNKAIKLDLELQARIYEGLFRAIAQREWIAGIFPFSYNLIEQPGSKSFDIRGKPAEEVFVAYSRALSE